MVLTRLLQTNIILGNADIRLRCRGVYLDPNLEGTSEESDRVFWNKLLKGNEEGTL